jgi:inositol-phosphate phosphatase/L-galactose 1-phosphate phosphatase/histidinol-phosphatase
MALPSASSIDDFRRFAESVADRARTMSLPYFRGHIDVQLKGDSSPVTAVDRDVETMVRECIEAAFPDHGVLGEEFGPVRADAEYVWSIDPIDGTRSFVTGWPLWGTLLALLHKGVPVLGLIDMPVLDERWVGIVGKGSQLNGRPCRSRRDTALADATIYATSPDIFSPAELAVFERVSRAAKSRRFGGDCYSYALLASGHIDAVIEADLKPFDYLALAPVIEAAGGVITDWKGGRLDIHSGGRVVAASSVALHREIMALIGND